MNSLEEVTGSYRVYLKTITKSGAMGFCWKLRAALTLAIAYAQNLKVETYVTEEVPGPDGKPTARIYQIPAGGGLPELMAPLGDAKPEDAKNGRVAGLEVL